MGSFKDTICSQEASLLDIKVQYQETVSVQLLSKRLSFHLGFKVYIS